MTPPEPNPSTAPVIDLSDSPVTTGGLIKPTKTRTPSLSNGHDAATAKELLKRYTDAQTGMRRVVAFGLLAWEVKETKLKHGEWGPWLAAHAPALCRTDAATGKPKSSHALDTYMSLTKGVLESLGFTVSKYLNHISNSPEGGICHNGKYLLLADKTLPAEARALKARICELVDGKTQRQLFLDFKQAEDDGSGGLRAKHGRLKGQGGASKEQREAAQQAATSAEHEAIRTRAANTAEWLLEVADDAHLGVALDTAEKTTLLEALDTAAGYLRRSALPQQAHL